MWGGDYLLGSFTRLGYERSTTVAFAAADSNFELAIAVATTIAAPVSSKEY